MPPMLFRMYGIYRTWGSFHHWSKWQQDADRGNHRIWLVMMNWEVCVHMVGGSDLFVEKIDCGFTFFFLCFFLGTGDSKAHLPKRTKTKHRVRWRNKNYVPTSKFRGWGNTKTLCWLEWIWVDKIQRITTELFKGREVTVKGHIWKTKWNQKLNGEEKDTRDIWFGQMVGERVNIVGWWGEANKHQTG